MTILRMTADQALSKSATNRAAHVPRLVKVMGDKPPKAIALPVFTGKIVKRQKPPKVKHPLEHAEQVMLINWWRDSCKAFGLDERLLFAIPNGSNKSAAAAMKFKAEGLRSGVPDLMLAVPLWWTKDCDLEIFRAGLFIEMKRVKGRKPDDEQTAYHDLLRAQGYRVEVCYGAEAAKAVITEYLGRA